MKSQSEQKKHMAENKRLQIERSNNEWLQEAKTEEGTKEKTKPRRMRKVAIKAWKPKENDTNNTKTTAKKNGLASFSRVTSANKSHEEHRRRLQRIKTSMENERDDRFEGMGTWRIVSRVTKSNRILRKVRPTEKLFFFI